MPSILEALSFLSCDYFTTGSAGLSCSFWDCSFRTLNSFPRDLWIVARRTSKMPEANYLLSVSWGYIKVG